MDVRTIVEQLQADAGGELSRERLSLESAALNALLLLTEKSKLEEKQVASLKKNVEYNKMLFNDGSATYLEVITAQQSLLNAELSKVADDFYKMQAVVNLYYALGGGRY